MKGIGEWKSFYTFLRSKTQRLYGSSANACWMQSIAPGISASVSDVTTTGILSKDETSGRPVRLFA